MNECKSLVRGDVSKDESSGGGQTALRGYSRELPGPGKTFAGRISDISIASTAHALLPPSGDGRCRGSSGNADEAGRCRLPLSKPVLYPMVCKVAYGINA